MFEIAHPDYESTFLRQGFLKEGPLEPMHGWYRKHSWVSQLDDFFISAFHYLVTTLTSAVFGFYCMPEYIGIFLARVSAFDTRRAAITIIFMTMKSITGIIVVKGKAATAWHVKGAPFNAT